MASSQSIGDRGTPALGNNHGRQKHFVLGHVIVSHSDWYEVATIGPRHVSPSLLHNLPVSPSRTYASKSKVKSTASFIPCSQQRLDSEETRAEYAKAESKMTSAVDWFRKEVAAFETRASGRVTPVVLSLVRIERGCGQAVKLEEVATVGVKDGSVLIATVFDEHVRDAFFCLSFPSFQLVAGVRAHGYLVEYEGSGAGDICRQTAEYRSPTTGFPDTQDTNTQVGFFPDICALLIMHSVESGTVHHTSMHYD